MGAICQDCGLDTTPRPVTKGTWEWYMVLPEIWAQAGMPPMVPNEHGLTDEEFLCLGCIEARLGRLLNASDFTSQRVNEPSEFDTPRLVSRKGT